jgi:hypothetical protein
MNHQTSNPAREDYLYSLAVQACVYAWPLFEMHRMRSATSARKAQGQGFAGDRPESLQRWCNLFTHERALLTAGKSRVVMPNNDTLYANAWLDLSQQPLVISMPDTGSRYYVLGFLDYYTNPFAHLGTRTTGNRARSVLVSGPGWSGEVPEAFQAEGCHVRSSTDWVWIIGRILVDGVPDVPEVNALQDQFSMQTLSDWRAGRPSPARRFDARFEARAPLTGSRFRAMVNDAMAHCPPPSSDALLVAQFKPLGLGVGAQETGECPDPVADHALERALATVQTMLQGSEASVFGASDDADILARGPAWRMPAYLGESFGHKLLRRAFVARQGIGQLSTAEAAYLRCETDSLGQQLQGRRRYAMRFGPDQMPPVGAFWSITLYRSSDYFLVENPIERYSIGDRTPGLVRDDDGGLTLTIAAQAPLDARSQANWLPSCEEAFFLCLRAYLPLPPLLDGTYQLPVPEVAS